MRIVLDTNILRQDLLLTSRKLEMLLDFAGKTQSKIVLPQIVYQELESVYEREIVGRLGDFCKAREMLNRRLVKTAVPDIEIEIESEVSQYLAYVRQKLGVADGDIVPYRDSYLPSLVNRAIKRERPCSAKGEEFRDALLWMTVLDLAEVLQGEPVAFISGNTKEFADKNRNLHPSLVDEASRRNVSIDYYDSLDRFLKEQATKLEFITEQWVLGAIATERMQLQVDGLLGISGDVRPSPWLEVMDPFFARFQSAHLIGIEDIRDFYVYEMLDGSIRVAITFVGEVEVEYIAVEEEVKEYWNYGFGFLPDKGDHGWGHFLEKEVLEHEECKLIYSELVIEALMILVNQEIKDIEIVDWDVA